MTSTESIIGGLWLQNVGSVLVLLGVFFLILWGYTTGHLGPGALVAAAVVVGAVVAWRGDRMARRLPAIGHALIGVGLGIVYLALYLGHFVLHVLPTPATYVSLAVVALVSLRLGRHYRVQAIQVLAVLGAFVPFIAPVMAGTGQPATSPAALFGYLAIVNLAVFALTAREGFSGLAMESLVLTTLTWMTATGMVATGPWLTVGLALLYLGFGHSPLPRLARTAEPVRLLDRLAIVLAPAFFLLAASPDLLTLTRQQGGAVLLALALVEAMAALWLDRRRRERDAWNALVGAAVVYATAALGLLAGSTPAPLVWSVEGVALLALGFAAESAWLRRLGVLVTGLGFLVSAASVAATAFVPPVRVTGAVPPLFTASALRGLVLMAALFVGEHLFRRERAHVEADESGPAIAAFGASARFVLFAWIGRLALRIGALAVSGPAVTAGSTPDAHAALVFQAGYLGWSIAAAAWLALALGFLWRGARTGEGLERIAGHAAACGGALAFAILLLVAREPALTAAGDAPFTHLGGPFHALFLLLAIGYASGLDRVRGALFRSEPSSAEAATVIVNLLILPWSALEMVRFAHLLPAQPSVNLAAVAVSGAWALQAIVLIALGWARAASLLRWLGLGLLGLTLVKILLFDLSEVGVFWRFVVAIGFGIVLMALSYVYQHLQRRAVPPAPADRAAAALRELEPGDRHP